jgi:hypothetical protein
MKLRYNTFYNTSEKMPPMPGIRIYVWGKINDTKIRIHIEPSEVDVQKKLRCKFTL